jgi:hypothetical protein
MKRIARTKPNPNCIFWINCSLASHLARTTVGHFMPDMGADRLKWQPATACKGTSLSPQSGVRVGLPADIQLFYEQTVGLGCRRHGQCALHDYERVCNKGAPHSDCLSLLAWAQNGNYCGLDALSAGPTEMISV